MYWMAMATFNDFMTHIGSGDYLGAIVLVYTNVMGETLFWGSMMGIVFIPMFIRSRGVILLSVVVLSSASVLLYFVPEVAHPIVYLALALELAALFVRLYNK